MSELVRTASRPAARHRKTKRGAIEPGGVSSGAAARDAGERDFRPDIQGLRAIAVTMVVIYHLYPSRLPGGFAGVDVFFVISGFLITGHLWRGYRRAGTVDLADFWGRRAKRLLPAASVVLAVTWLASYALLPTTRLADTAAQIRASALYFQNWLLAHNAVDYLKSNDVASPVQHFWSLSVEEQFYLVWPLLFVAAALVTRHRTRAGHAVAGGLAAVLVVVSLAYSVHHTRIHPQDAYFVTTTRMWELGLGGLLALLPERFARPAGRQGWLGWAGLAMVIASLFVLRGTTPFPGAIALLPTVGSAALIAGGSAEGRYGPGRLLSVRPMVFTGGISYSLYLWHWPLIVLWTSYRNHGPGMLSGPFLVVVSVVLSWLTKVFVEDKVRRARLLAGHRWRSVGTALAAAVPVALVSVYLAGQHPWDGKLGPDYPGAAVLARHLSVLPEPVLPPLDALTLPSYWQRGCLDKQETAAPKECVFGDTKHPVLTVALVGDSIAGNWAPALQQIARQRHWKLVTDLHSNCAWTATMMTDPGTGGPYTACQAWGATVLRHLITAVRPAAVITSDHPGMSTVAHPAGGSAAQQDIGVGMADYWRQLERHGIPVIAIRESPDLIINEPECVARHGGSAAPCAIPVAKAIMAHPPTSYAAPLMAGRVTVINMNPLLCGPRKCSPVVGNVLVYFDNHHLTSSYSVTTAPFLEKLLLRADKTLAVTADRPAAAGRAPATG